MELNLGELLRRIRTIVLVSLTVIVVVLVITIAVTTPTRTWWYDAFLPWVEPTATVVAALATIVGVGAAIVAAIYGARVFERERQRDQDLQDLRLQDQASQVGSWLTVGEIVAGGERTWHQHLTILNDSRLPVFDVVAHLVHPNDDGTTVGWSIDALPPHTTEVTDFGQKPIRYEHELRFRDMGNKHWKRDEDGVLSPDE